MTGSTRTRNELSFGQLRQLLRGELSFRQLLREQLNSPATIVRWGLVGAFGYLIYQSLLFLVYDSNLFAFLPDKDRSVTLVLFEHGDARFLIATLAATAVALVTAFTGHNLWTFRDGQPVRKHVVLRFVQFVAAALISALGIVTVTVNVLTVQFSFYHFLALPIAVGLGSIWDWLWYSQFVWRRSGDRHAGAHFG